MGTENSKELNDPTEKSKSRKHMLKKAKHFYELSHKQTAGQNDVASSLKNAAAASYYLASSLSLSDTHEEDCLKAFREALSYSDQALKEGEKQQKSVSWTTILRLDYEDYLQNALDGVKSLDIKKACSAIESFIALISDDAYKFKCFNRIIEMLLDGVRKELDAWNVSLASTYIDDCAVFLEEANQVVPLAGRQQLQHHEKELKLLTQKEKLIKEILVGNNMLETAKAAGNPSADTIQEIQDHYSNSMKIAEGNDEWNSVVAYAYLGLAKVSELGGKPISDPDVQQYYERADKLSEGKLAGPDIVLPTAQIPLRPEEQDDQNGIQSGQNNEPVPGGEMNNTENSPQSETTKSPESTTDSSNTKPQAGDVSELHGGPFPIVDESDNEETDLTPNGHLHNGIDDGPAKQETDYYPSNQDPIDDTFRDNPDGGSHVEQPNTASDEGIQNAPATGSDDGTQNSLDTASNVSIQNALDTGFDDSFQNVLDTGFDDGFQNAQDTASDGGIQDKETTYVNSNEDSRSSMNVDSDEDEQAMNLSFDSDETEQQDQSVHTFAIEQPNKPPRSEGSRSSVGPGNSSSTAQKRDSLTHSQALDEFDFLASSVDSDNEGSITVEIEESDEEKSTSDDNVSHLLHSSQESRKHAPEEPKDEPQQDIPLYEVNANRKQTRQYGSLTKVHVSTSEDRQGNFGGGTKMQENREPFPVHLVNQATPIQTNNLSPQSPPGAIYIVNRQSYGYHLVNQYTTRTGAKHTHIPESNRYVTKIHLVNRIG